MIGKTIAHYEITGKLGEGAMGEVYRATDSRLKRDVAIKLLSSRLAADPELVARLRREAEVLASLNHTNIGQIYGLEPSGDSLALVLELVEGETLDDRLKKGSLPLDRALKVAHQIAAALETAHEAGIIHRDLKPANVKRTPDGDVKVLDFGLAKGIRLNEDGTDLTVDGAIIGTPAYMSPEQVEGKPLDRRTDIWSFGCVLYEMLTGSKAFGGDSVGSLFAAIATQNPELERIADAPAPVRRLIERCLRKDPKKRLRDIGDARVELEELIAGGAEPEPAITPMRKRPTVAVTALAVVGVLAAIAMLRPTPDAKPTPPSIAQYSIALFHPSGALHLDSPAGAAPPLTVSADGRKVAFTAMSSDGVRRIYLRTAESALLRPLAGTETAEAPFFSPDGKEVGFLRTGGDGVHRISLADGTVRKIAETLVVRGASWGRDDTIVFAHSDLGLRRVSASGGEVTNLTTVAADEHHHRWPQLLPDGKHVIFTALMRDRRLEPRILSLESGEVVALGVQGSFARYLPAGFLVYTKENQAWAVRFDLEAKKKVGEPVRVARPIHVSELGNPHLAISEAGVLVFEPRRPPSPGRSLVWVDRDGTTEVINEGKGFEFPSLSPDGDWVIFANHTETNSHDIWKINLKRDPPAASQVTRGGNFIGPVWSHDGKAIVFSEFRDRDMWIQELAGDAEARKLVEREGWQFPSQWTADRLVFFEVVPGRASDILELNLEDMQERSLVAKIDNEQAGTISPDGHWLAFVSNKTGGAEVYVRSYAELGTPKRVSLEGGTEPLWSHDGRELFFRKGRKLIVVEIEGERIGKPRTVLEGPFVAGFQSVANYDVTQDGKRFIMVDGGWGLTHGRLDVHLHFDREIAAALRK